jgi:hypothetical protein
MLRKIWFPKAVQHIEDAFSSRAGDSRWIRFYPIGKVNQIERNGYILRISALDNTRIEEIAIQRT